MSRVTQQSTTVEYYIDLDTMKQIIADDMQVPVDEISVQYVEGQTGPGDPMDRFPAPRGIVGIKVFRKTA